MCKESADYFCVPNQKAELLFIDTKSHAYLNRTFSRTSNNSKSIETTRKHVNNIQLMIANNIQLMIADNLLNQ